MGHHVLFHMLCSTPYQKLNFAKYSFCLHKQCMWTNVWKNWRNWILKWCVPPVRFLCFVFCYLLVLLILESVGWNRSKNSCQRLLLFPYYKPMYVNITKWKIFKYNCMRHFLIDCRVQQLICFYFFFKYKVPFKGFYLRKFWNFDDFSYKRNCSSALWFHALTGQTAWVTCCFMILFTYNSREVHEQHWIYTCIGINI